MAVFARRGRKRILRGSRQASTRTTRDESYEIAGHFVPEGKSTVLFARLVDPEGPGGTRSPHPLPDPGELLRAHATAHEGVEIVATHAGLFVFAFASVHAAARCALAWHRAIAAFNGGNGCGL